jgi:hypothetical protein
MAGTSLVPLDYRRRYPGLEPDVGAGTPDLRPHRMNLDGAEVAATYSSIHATTPFTVAPSLSYERSFATPPCQNVKYGGGTNVRLSAAALALACTGCAAYSAGPVGYGYDPGYGPVYSTTPGYYGGGPVFGFGAGGGWRGRNWHGDGSHWHGHGGRDGSEHHDGSWHGGGGHGPDGHHGGGHHGGWHH